jgi:antitoxin YefM
VGAAPGSKCPSEQNPVQSSAVAKTVPFSEARARLSELLDELESRHEHVVITRNGRPAAVLVPAAEQEALEETLEILQDEELLKALHQSEEDVRSGRLTSLREVRRELGLG